MTGTGGLTVSGAQLQPGESAIVTDQAPVTLTGSAIFPGNSYGIDTASGPVTVSGSSYIFNGHLAGIRSSSGTVTVTDSGMSSGGSAIVSDGDVSLLRANIVNAGADDVVVNGTTTIVNSTILWSRGDGVVAGGPTTLVYSSVGLSAAFGGGTGLNLAFGGAGGSYVLQNSLVTRQAHFLGQLIPNSTPTNCGAGPITSQGYNQATTRVVS